MKKNIYAMLMVAVLVLAVTPGVIAAGIGTGLGGEIGVEEFVPIVWQCGERVLTDDEQQPWRVSLSGDDLTERTSNYLFEGEKYLIDVVVFDKNKIDTVDVQLKMEGYGDDFTVNCIPNTVDLGESGCDRNSSDVCFESCNARIGEEDFDSSDFDSSVMEGYTCTFTTPLSEDMSGDVWMTVEACDNDAQGGECGEYDEISPWFINPVIELGLDGDLEFSDVRPGTASYATISIENEAEGGVLLDMFITGRNWPAADLTDTGRCAEVDPVTEIATGELVNYLPLGAFRYYAEAGSYDTRMDLERDGSNFGTGGAYSSVTRNVDDEGYVNINQQVEAGFTTIMFDDAEIIQAAPLGVGYGANILTPGEVMGITFRLMLPEPCYGEFESADEGSIFIWAEAI